MDINNQNEITPRLVGAFSVDENRNYANHLNNLRYVKDVSEDTIPINLTKGVSVAKESYDPYERLHQITGFLKD